MEVGAGTVVPVTGKQIRAAARSGGFARVLTDCWDEAVNL